ncbi:MAG: DUF6691 family protein [Planctomycetota bacterium]|jgi:uncharacterized membrane protein YedE/YeeE
MTKQLGVILVGGLLFGFGLAWSGLVQQEIVLSFLRLEDLGLALMMGAALLVAMPLYQIVPRVRSTPPLGPTFDRFPRRVTGRSVLGGAIFGVGWGISGVCPGAALASLGTGNWPILAALAGLLAGAYLQGAFLAERPAAAAGTPA